MSFLFRKFRPVAKKPLETVSYSDMYESMMNGAKILVEEQQKLFVQKHVEICFLRDMYLKNSGSDNDVQRLLSETIKYNYVQFMTTQFLLEEIRSLDPYNGEGQQGGGETSVVRGFLRKMARIIFLVSVIFPKSSSQPLSLVSQLQNPMVPSSGVPAVKKTAYEKFKNEAVNFLVAQVFGDKQPELINALQEVVREGKDVMSKQCAEFLGKEESIQFLFEQYKQSIPGTDVEEPSTTLSFFLGRTTSEDQEMKLANMKNKIKPSILLICQNQIPTLDIQYDGSTGTMEMTKSDSDHLVVLLDQIANKIDLSEKDKHVLTYLTAYVSTVHSLSSASDLQNMGSQLKDIIEKIQLTPETLAELTRNKARQHQRNVLQKQEEELRLSEIEEKKKDAELLKQEEIIDKERNEAELKVSAEGYKYWNENWRLGAKWLGTTIKDAGMEAVLNPVMDAMTSLMNKFLFSGWGIILLGIFLGFVLWAIRPMFYFSKKRERVIASEGTNSHQMTIKQDGIIINMQLGNQLSKNNAEFIRHIMKLNTKGKESNTPKRKTAKKSRRSVALVGRPMPVVSTSWRTTKKQIHKMIKQLSPKVGPTKTSPS